MTDPLEAVFAREGSASVVERLERLTHLGRSSRYGFRRHGIMRGAAYRRALTDAQSLPSSERLMAETARARRLIGSRDDALWGLDQALARDPRLAAAYAWRWEARLGPGIRGSLSSADIDRAVKLEPKVSSWRAWRGLGRLPSWRNALSDFDAALKLDAGCVPAHVGRALALSGLKTPRKAIASLDEAIRLEPAQGWLHRLRARAKLELKDLEGFLADAESAIILDEDIGVLANALGSVPNGDPKAYWMHAFRGGLENLETAVALRPDCAWAWAYLSRARLDAGLKAPAFEAIDRAIWLRGDCGWFRIWRGEMLRLKGDLSAAQRNFDEGLALSPDYELGYARRGAARLAAGRPRQALEDLDLAAALKPGDAFAVQKRAETVRELGAGAEPKAAAAAHVERAMSARESGRLEEARREADAAVLLDDGEKSLEARAQILSDMGYVAEALSDMDQALRAAGPRAGLYARRAQFHLQRRNYPEAQSDLDRGVKLAEGNPWLLAKRAELFILTDRPALAQRDLDRAVSLAPEEETLRLARLRLLVQRGRRAPAAAEIRKLISKGSARGRLEAVFSRGCLDFKARRQGCGEADFRRLMKELPEEDHLSMRARLYWVASRAVDPSFRKRHSMKNAKQKPPMLYLCGLGIFPPYTASLEVLHAISRCDVVFNNVAGAEVRDLLAEFCSDIRPASYQAWQDEPKWANSMFKELDKGRTVGFVTRGHPLIFGGLAVELIRRCKETGMPHETFGAVSSIDHLLAYTGKGLGDDFGGIQAIDRPAVEAAKHLNTSLPLLACFYSGLTGPAIKAFRRSLERFYPAGHGCWMFGPKYDSPPAVLRLGDLEKRFPDIHSSLMLYVPPLEAPKTKRERAA